MSLNLVTLLYLVASVCFIQALKGLSHPTTSIRGNLFGMVGMTIAVLTTAALIVKLSGEMGQTRSQGMLWVLVGLLVGGGVGAVMAKRVEMTKMPELVAFMHSMIGLAAVWSFLWRRKRNSKRPTCASMKLTVSTAAASSPTANAIT